MYVAHASVALGVTVMYSLSFLPLCSIVYILRISLMLQLVILDALSLCLMLATASQMIIDLRCATKFTFTFKTQKCSLETERVQLHKTE